MRLSLGAGWRGRLWRNLPFAASGFFFYWLNVLPSASGVASILLAALLAGVAAAAAPDLRAWLARQPKPMLAVAALGAVGVCWFNVRTFGDAWRASTKLRALAQGLSVPHEALLTALGALTAALSAWYALVLLCALYRWLWDALRESGFRLERAEKIALAVLFAAMSGYMLYMFGRSVAFYGGDVPFDLVYTSDSPILVRENAYLCLRQLQNDIRQPLFAVFAAPFAAPMYALSLALPFWPHADAALMNLAQVALLLFACVLLVKLLDVPVAVRIALTACFCATYTALLFSVMMEQYVVAVFWLALALYLTRTAPRRAPFALIAACGSMLTSVALAPVVCLCARQSWRDRLALLGRLALGGLAALCFFGRLNIITDSFSTLLYLSRFTGEGLPFAGRLLQYAAFVAGCFAAPAAGQRNNAIGYYSWQLLPVEQVSWLGVTIIALAVLGLVVCRRDRLARACGWWAAFSFVILCVVGWGTAENGLMLYALYFGWAYFLLLFKLLQWALARLRAPAWASPAACGLAAAGMLWYNAPQLARMVALLGTYYRP